MDTYSKALKRLEEIVTAISGENADIDTLTSQLKEAKALIDFCRQKLCDIEEETNKILDDKENGE